jgi:hypothetical protein
MWEALSKKHLNKCLQRAKERKDEEQEKEKLAIIQQEKDQSFWQKINYVMGKPHGGSVQQVLVEDSNEDGNLVENTTQKLVQEAIFNNIHCKLFFLVEAAPLVTIPLQRRPRPFLQEPMNTPPDFDQATREICEKRTLIWEMIPIDTLNTLITKDDWRQQWKGRCESTSSLELRFTFWKLCCRTVLRPHLMFACFESNSYYQKGCFRLLGKGSFCYARENVWLCTYHKAQVNSTHGGGL